MSNPWTKKNPLMSTWLSAANSAAGSVAHFTTVPRLFQNGGCRTRLPDSR